MPGLYRVNRLIVPNFILERAVIGALQHIPPGTVAGEQQPLAAMTAQGQA